MLLKCISVSVLMQLTWNVLDYLTDSKQNSQLFYHLVQNPKNNISIQTFYIIMFQEKEFGSSQWIENEIRLIKSLILFHCYGPPCISFTLDLQYSNLSAKNFGTNLGASSIRVMITPCVIFQVLIKFTFMFFLYYYNSLRNNHVSIF